MCKGLPFFMLLKLENIESEFNAEYIENYKLLKFDNFNVQVLKLFSQTEVNQILQKVDLNNCSICARLDAKDKSYKRVLSDKYAIINHLQSVFKKYVLAVDKTHYRKKDIEKVKNILSIAQIYKGSVVLSDGISFPDEVKRHFTIQILKKDYFPLTNDIDSGVCLSSVFADENIEISLLKKQIRSAFVIKSKNYQWIFNVYLELEKLLGRSYSLSKYPYINYCSYCNNDEYVLVIFPRVVQKPVQYYDSSPGKIKIFPGALELMGMFIVNDSLYYNNLTEESVKSIYEQISYSFSSLTDIFKPLLPKLKEAFYLK